MKPTSTHCPFLITRIGSLATALALALLASCAVATEPIDVIVRDALGETGADAPTGDTPGLDARDAALDATACRSDADCRTGVARICDMVSGTCVQCLAAALTASCPVGAYCTAAQTCAPGCGRDSDCSRVGDGGVRDAGPVVDGGVPSTVLCDVATHTCTRCLGDAECAPGSICSLGHCVPGCSTSHPCATGSTCCTGMCVSTTSDPMHCGSCTTRCSAINGTATCTAGACSVRCNAGFGDCDMNPTNGCEADTAASMANCGMCGAACAPAHGTGACLTGLCAVTGCDAGYQDCDHDSSNGCEVNTQSDALNCGRCSRSCPSGLSCVSGGCTSTPLYHGWTCPIAGCSTASYNTTAATADGGMYPYNTGDSANCRAWKLAATVCTTQPVGYGYTPPADWSCPRSGGFADPVFGTFCAVTSQYSCSDCYGACNAGTCSYRPLSLRNCSGSETAQP